MTTIAPTAPFLYVDSDVPEGQTLVEWRRARNAEQRTTRRFRLRLRALKG